MPILEPMCVTCHCSDMTTARTATDYSLEYQTVAGQKVPSITSGPIETFGALLSQTYEFLRDGLSEHGGSSPSTSVLVTWFRQRIAVTLQRAQARAIHARTARLEATSSLLSTLPTCAVISAGDLMAIVGSS